MNKTFQKIIAACSFVVIVTLILFFTQANTARDFFYIVENYNTPIQEAKKIDGSAYTLTDHGLKTGISEVTLYIYAVGTTFNYESIESSLANAQNVGSSDKVKVLVLYDPPEISTQYKTTQVFFLERAEDGQIRSDIIADLGIVNSTDPQIMYDFLSFGMENFPAKKNLLILDGVGKGSQGLLYDESHNSYLSAASLQQAISSVLYSGGLVFDTLVINTSYGAGIEMLSSLARFVKHVVTTTDAVSPRALDYGNTLIELNTISLSSSKDISIQLLKAAITEASCGSWNLYETKGLLNTNNGLESLATKILRDPEGKILNQFFISLNKSSYIAEESESRLALFSFSCLTNQMAESGNQLLAAAGQRISQDVTAATINPFCLNKETVLLSFPTNSQSPIPDHFSAINYSTLPSFKELLRLSFSVQEITQDPVDKVEIQSNTFSANYTKNTHSCGQALVLNNFLYDLSRYIPEKPSRAEVQFLCPRNETFTYIKESPLPMRTLGTASYHQEFLSVLNNKKIIGELQFINGQEKVITSKVGTNDLSILLESLQLNGRFIFDVVDKDGQEGVYYTDWKTITAFETEEKNVSESTPYISYVYGKGNTLRSRYYGTNVSLPNTLKHSYNIFALYDGYINASLPIKEFTLKPMPTFSPFRTNLERKEVTSVNYSKQGYQYSEFIFAQRIELDPKKKTLRPINTNYGNDLIYYKGELLPQQDNITFWTEWIQSENN